MRKRVRAARGYGEPREWVLTPWYWDRGESSQMVLPPSHHPQLGGPHAQWGPTEALPNQPKKMRVSNPTRSRMWGGGGEEEEFIQNRTRARRDS